MNELFLHRSSSYRRFFFYSKSPAVRPTSVRARTHRRAVIAWAACRAKRAAARTANTGGDGGSCEAAEPSTFLHGGTECELCMPVYSKSTIARRAIKFWDAGRLSVQIAVHALASNRNVRWTFLSEWTVFCTLRRAIARRAISLQNVFVSGQRVTRNSYSKDR